MPIVKLGDTDKKKLLEYMETEFGYAEKEVLDPLQAHRSDWDDLYYGRTEPRSADWMSNFPILMGATFTDAVRARLMNTLTAYRPQWTLEPTKNSGWQEVARATEKLLDYQARVEMGLFRELSKCMFETVRLGTGVIMTPWVEEVTPMTVKGLFRNRVVNTITKQGIRYKAIPMRDFLFPGGYTELDELPFWSRRMRWTPMMLREQRFKKYYEFDDDLLKAAVSDDEHTRKAQERSGEEQGMQRRIVGWEGWIKYDLKGDGDLKRYIATVNFDKKVILRFEEDTYPRWPLQMFRYGPRDFGICGLGVMEMTAPFDNALYALYNLLVDNYKVATMQCLKARKGSGMTAKTKLYPGKMFFMTDIDKDLQPMMMGQPFALDPSFPRMIWELGERRSGISDYSLGRESSSAGGRATATGTLALIQEGQRRFDLTIRDIREGMDDAGMFALEMNHARLPKNVPYMLLGEDGQWVQQFLDMPETPPAYGLNMISTFSNRSLNKEVEKSDAQATMEILGSYYEQVLNLMMLLPQVPPKIGEVVIRIAKAASDKVKKVLEAYGETAPDTYTNIAEPVTGPSSQATGPQGTLPGMGAPPGMGGQGMPPGMMGGQGV